MLLVTLKSRLSSKRGAVLKPAIALLAFSGALGALGWMLLTPDALRAEIEARTGFPLEHESLVVNLFGTTVSGENIVIGNPSEFGGGRPMLEIARLKVDASLAALGRGEIWIYDMELHVPRATLLVNEQGKFNLDAFAEGLFAATDREGQMPFFAERVRLVVDEVTFMDNSRLVPSRRSLSVSLDTELHDLDDSKAIFGPLFELAARVGSLPIR